MSRTVATIRWAWPLLAVYCAHAAAPVAQDDSDDPAYDDVFPQWDSGDNGGIGFTPWVLSPPANSTNGGFFTASAAQNGFPSSGGSINTPDGDAWGVFANGTSTAVAVRGFDLNGDAALDGIPFNHTFHVRMDNGGNNGFVGFILRSGNDTANKNNGQRFEFLHIASNNYHIADSSGLVDTGIPWTPDGLDIAVTLINANSYMARITPIGGETYTHIGTLSGSGGINSVALYNEHAGAGAGFDVYFNSMAVDASLSEPDAASFKRVGGHLNLNFDGQTNVSYRVDTSTNLLAGWTPGSGPIPGNGASSLVAISTTSPAQVAYFRMAVESAVSFVPRIGPLTNGVTVSVPVQFVAGLLTTNQSLTVELVDTNGVSYGRAEINLNPGTDVSYIYVNVPIDHDLPFGDHVWTMRAYVAHAATGDWNSASARWASSTSLKVFPSFLSAEGRHIVDELDRTVALRGVNIGAWLVYEDWILYFSPTWVNEFAVREWLSHKELGGQAYPVFEGERFDAMQGVFNGGEYTGSLDAGDWFMFSNMVFEAGVRGMYLYLASANAGGQIEVRLDSPAGQLLGTMTVKNSGSYFTWNRQYVPFSSPVTGTRDLYFVGASGGGIANVNWFQLDLARLEAEQFDTMQGVNISGGHVGSFDDGDWYGFSNVNFGLGTRGMVINLAVDPGFANQQIEFRLASPTGALAGTHTVRTTGGWGDYDGQFADFTQNVSGVHNLYLVGRGTGGIADVDWIKVASDGLLQTFRDAFFSEYDFDDIKGLGYNILRVPFPASLLEDEEAPFSYKESGWELMDWVVEQARLRGMYVLFGMHASPGGHNPFSHNGQKDQVNRLWENFGSEPVDPCNNTLDNGPCYRERTDQMWDAISQRYKDNPTVMGYGLLNEPIADYGGNIAPFNARLYDTIRGNGDNHLILMMNPNFGQITSTPEQPNDMFSLIPDVHGNGWFGVVYEYHPYRYILDPFIDTSFDIQKASADLLVRQYDYVSHFRQTPILLGEFMPGSRRNFDYYTRQFNAYDVHWTHWNFRIPDTYSDWGLSYRSAAFDQYPNFETDDAATLQAKLASYNHTNYANYEQLRSVLGRNAADTNLTTYRADFYINKFSAPDASANTTWAYDGMEIQSDWLNGGFELDGLGPPGGTQLLGWQTFGSAFRQNFQPRGGAYHAQVFGLGAGGTNINFAGIEQKQVSRPGQVWQGTVYALLPGSHPSNNNKIRLQLEFYDNLAAQPSNLISTAISEVEAWWWSMNTYNLLQLRATAPENTKAAKMVAVYESKPFQDGSVYFDDARMEWLQNASDPGLLNSSFEAGTGSSFDNWTFSGGGQRANFGARSGSHAALLYGPGISGTTVSTSLLTQVVLAYTRQGEPWRAEVFAKPQDNPTSTNKVRLTMQFFSDAVANPSNLLSTHSFTWDSAWISKDKYNPLRVEGSAPTTATVAIKFSLAFLNVPATAGSMLMDDAALVNRSTDRVNIQIASNAAQVLLNGGPVQVHFKSRKDTDARFEIADNVGTRFSLVMPDVRVDQGGAFSLNLCALRDAATRKIYEYNTQGVIARMLYRQDTPTTQVTVQVYAKNWDLNTLGALIHTSSPVAFVPGAKLELFVNDASVNVKYGSSIDWTGNHGLDLSTWANGAAGIVEVEDVVAGGDSEYLLLDELKAVRPGADTSKVFHDSFEQYPQNAVFSEDTQFWTQSDDQSFVNGGQWLWKPNGGSGAASWLNPRWAYHEPVRLTITTGRVADVRVAYRNFTDWDAVAKICLLPESFTSTIYGNYTSTGLYLEVTRRTAGHPKQGNMWFRLFRHDGVGGNRTQIWDNDDKTYVDGQLISLQASTNNAAVYYGSEQLFNVAHGLNIGAVFPDGAIPHLEFQRFAQDFLFLDDVDCRERSGFTAP